MIGGEHTETRLDSFTRKKRTFVLTSPQGGAVASPACFQPFPAPIARL